MSISRPSSALVFSGYKDLNLGFFVVETPVGVQFDAVQQLDIVTFNYLGDIGQTYYDLSELAGLVNTAGGEVKYLAGLLPLINALWVKLFGTVAASAPPHAATGTLTGETVVNALNAALLASFEFYLNGDGVPQIREKSV